MTVPLVIQGRNVSAELKELAADPLQGGTRHGLPVLLYAKSGGSWEPLSLSGGSLVLTPRPSEIVDTVADETVNTGATGVVIAGVDVLEYQYLSGYLISNQPVTMSIEFSRLSAFTANKGAITSVVVAANEPFEFLVPVRAQWFRASVTNASGSTATINGQLLGVTV